MSNRDEISLKEILLIIREWYRYLLSKFLIILIVGIIGGICGLFLAVLSKPKYSASLNFILANSNQSNSGLLGIASQFGIDLTNNSNDVFTGNNIIALMKSRTMVQQALLKKPHNNKQSLLNIFCVDNKLNEGWNKDERLKHAYPFPDSSAQMSPVQDSLFREIYDIVQKKNLEVSLPDKDKNIYNVATTSTNEIFSYYLTTYLVDVTSAFYIDTKTSSAKQNLDMLNREADSLRSILGGAITSAGSQTDRTFNLNPAYQVKRSPAQQSQVSASALGQAYGQVLQNLELAKIALQKETPLYQVIDEPTLPLNIEKPSKFICVFVGGFLGGLLACFALAARRFVKSFKI